MRVDKRADMNLAQSLRTRDLVKHVIAWEPNEDWQILQLCGALINLSYQQGIKFTDVVEALCILYEDTAADGFPPIPEDAPGVQ